MDMRKNENPSKIGTAGRVIKQATSRAFFKSLRAILKFLTSRVFAFFASIGAQAVLLIWLAYYLGERSPYAAHINAVLYAISLVLMLHIISKKQNASYKMAWLIPVLAMPLLGILLYFFFSQRQLGKKSRKKLSQIYWDTIDHLKQDAAVLKEIENSDMDALRQTEYILNSSLSPIFNKTQTEYFPTGEDFFETLIEKLENAKRYIFLEFFIVREGKMWNAVLDILKRKVAEGVEVRFIYDDLGCMDTLPRNYYKKLREAGIRCEVFNRCIPVINSMFNNRNHRKTVIIDGHTAFVCGVNMADEYINEEERFGVWKDACLMARGKAVHGFIIMFLQLWDYVTEENSDVLSLMPLEEEVADIESDGYVQPYSDGPIDDNNLAENVYLNIINKAKEYVYINTPYLVPTDNLMAALKTAAEAGVDVRITTPHIPDKKGVFMLTRANYRELIESGVKIYEFTPGFMHSKTYVSDDKYAIVGTINTDFRSLFLHFECAVFMYNTSTVMDVKKDFLDALENCERVTHAKVKNVKWYMRLAQTVLKVFAPLL